MNRETLKNSYLQLQSDLKKARSVLALIGALPGFFRDQISVARAEQEIKRALACREDTFLEVVNTHIFQVPTSPYLPLLRSAGCEFADLRSHVRGHGLEETLRLLAKEGVYLTSDEYKGKREIVRGRLSFRVSPADFEYPRVRAGFSIQSSGTKNRPVSTTTSLQWLTWRTIEAAVFASAHNLFSYSHALYDAVLPVSSVSLLLANAKIGIRSDRWFARATPANSRTEEWYHRSVTRLMVLMGKCFGPGFPNPEQIEIKDIHRIVQWITEQKKRGQNAYIITVSSSAARIARVAWEMGESLEGTKFSVGAEPFTRAKEEAIRRVGATTTTRYAYGGGILAGSGCANPVSRDDVHVHEHVLAVISSPRSVGQDPLPIHPLLMTTLTSVAPRLLLNVENGDYVTLKERKCGCALGNVGLTRHLHHIRSFEKFTSEGMNYFYGDIYDLFESTLPSEFGGGPGDYQLVEEEDQTGQTRLTLVVDPALGQLDENAVLARVTAAFSGGVRTDQFMTRVWEAAGTFRIRRERPHASPRGKILPLHIPRANT